MLDFIFEILKDKFESLTVIFSQKWMVLHGLMGIWRDKTIKITHFLEKNSNSRQNLGPGTKSDFIFEISGVDLGGFPQGPGPLSCIFEN